MTTYQLNCLRVTKQIGGEEALNNTLKLYRTGGPFAAFSTNHTTTTSGAVVVAKAVRRKFSFHFSFVCGPAKSLYPWRRMPK